MKLLNVDLVLVKNNLEEFVEKCNRPIKHIVRPFNYNKPYFCYNEEQEKPLYSLECGGREVILSYFQVLIAAYKLILLNASGTPEEKRIKAASMVAQSIHNPAGVCIGGQPSLIVKFYRDYVANHNAALRDGALQQVAEENRKREEEKEILPNNANYLLHYLIDYYVKNPVNMEVGVIPSLENNKFLQICWAILQRCVLKFGGAAGDQINAIYGMTSTRNHFGGADVIGKMVGVMAINTVAATRSLQQYEDEDRAGLTPTQCQVLQQVFNKDNPAAPLTERQARLLQTYIVDDDIVNPEKVHNALVPEIPVDDGVFALGGDIINQVIDNIISLLKHSNEYFAILEKVDFPHKPTIKSIIQEISPFKLYEIDEFFKPKDGEQLQIIENSIDQLSQSLNFFEQVIENYPANTLAQIKQDFINKIQIVIREQQQRVKLWGVVPALPPRDAELDRRRLEQEEFNRAAEQRRRKERELREQPQLQVAFPAPAVPPPAPRLRPALPPVLLRPLPPAVAVRPAVLQLQPKVAVPAIVARPAAVPAPQPIVIARQPVAPVVQAQPPQQLAAPQQPVDNRTLAQRLGAV